MYEGMTDLLEYLKGNDRSYDLEKIIKAYNYADDLHAGQMRLSGEPYISHPVAVARIVAELGLDTDSICAALLHDTVEDCADKTNLDILSKMFGPDVALLVDGLTKIIQVQVADKEEAHIENIRKMLLAMTKDIRVIFIKLCDRLHNMRTLSAKKEDRQRAIALETMYIYAPLAHRLGIQRIKQELENLSLFYLDNVGYQEVQEEIDKKFGRSGDFIDVAKGIIRRKLAEHNIDCTLEGRVKSVYSLYRKMYSQNKAFDEIYDFYAVRVIVDTELECYTALGYIHEEFKSIPGRFKDYISTPKPNLYRSLHTTVIGQSGIPFEVQIRTKQMHEEAQFGIAAHWKYKSGEKSSKANIDEKLRWIAQLLESDESTRDPDEFIHSFKTDIFHDETFVFTPKGDVISLPFGSTCIDFAYAIHSAVGNKMTGAKINGVIVPIDRIPSNGDIIEIITSNASKGPSRDWLKIVKTGQARSKIRQWFKKESRAENIELGRVEVERECRRIYKGITDEQIDEIITSIGKKVSINNAEDFYATIGFGGLSLSRFMPKIKEEIEKLRVSDEGPLTAEDELAKVKLTNVTRKHKAGGIIIEGDTGYQVKFAKCCNPLPGDKIVGFVTRGFGVSVHKADCPNVIASRGNEDNLARWIRADWEQVESAQSYYEASIQIIAEDQIGVLANISMALADMKVSISQINTQSTKDGVAINIVVGCRNVSHYDSIVSRLRSLQKIISVRRGFTN